MFAIIRLTNLPGAFGFLAGMIAVACLISAIVIGYNVSENSWDESLLLIPLFLFIAAGVIGFLAIGTIPIK